MPHAVWADATLARMSDKPKSDARKQSLYFPEEMLQEITDEAQRLERSLSWVVQRAWKLARTDMKKVPGVNEPGKQHEDE